jgi:hypothetical protein
MRRLSDDEILYVVPGSVIDSEGLTVFHRNGRAAELPSASGVVDLFAWQTRVTR